VQQPVTILDIAKFLGVEEGEGGQISGGEFLKYGLPIIGGCSCGTTVAVYNAYPTRSGYLGCSGCVGDDGWESCDQAIRDIFEDSPDDVRLLAADGEWA